LAYQIRILCANDNTTVVGQLSMQSNKVTSIHRNHGSLMLNRKRNDFLVRNPQICVASLLYGQHVMTQLPQQLG